MLSMLMPALYGIVLLLSLSGGFLLLLAVPNLALTGLGHPLLPGFMHLLTLGGFLTGAYVLQQGIWIRIYGEKSRIPWLMGLVWCFHAPGLALLLWGYFDHSTLLEYIGGHYLVPTGIVLAVFHGLWGLWRRPRGVPKRLYAHLPNAGLLLTMSLGSLLVMDALLGLYDIYTPTTILIHLLSGGFLFALPLLLSSHVLPDEIGGEFPFLFRWYGVNFALGGGVFAITLALAPGGAQYALPVGLALLGAVLVWLALPDRRRSRGLAEGLAEGLNGRVGRMAMGLLVLYAAIRLGRGAADEEMLLYARVGVLFFFTGVALPELLHGLTEPAPSLSRPGSVAIRHWMWLAGAAAVSTGQIWLVPLPVRIGAALWLAVLIWWGWSYLRGNGRDKS